MIISHFIHRQTLSLPKKKSLIYIKQLPCCFEKIFFCLWSFGLLSITGLKNVTCSSNNAHHNLSFRTKRVLKCLRKMLALFCKVIAARIPKCFNEMFLPLQTECPGVRDRDTCHVVGYPESLPTSETSLHTEISSHANKRRFPVHVTMTVNTHRKLLISNCSAIVTSPQS